MSKLDTPTMTVNFFIMPSCLIPSALFPTVDSLNLSRLAISVNARWHPLAEASIWPSQLHPQHFSSNFLSTLSAGVKPTLIAFQPSGVKPIEVDFDKPAPKTVFNTSNTKRKHLSISALDKRRRKSLKFICRGQFFHEFFKFIPSNIVQSALWLNSFGLGFSPSF